MVMELGSARWTSNSPRPFARSPGGGLAMHESGFAATPTNDAGIEMDPLLILGKGPFTVVREPIATGTIPSMVVRFRYTDRGTMTQSVLDAHVKGLLVKSGFKSSIATSFKSERVTWRWQKDSGGTFYFPVVSTPANLAGIRYAGNHITLPAYDTSDAQLAKLPNEIWTYTIGLTSQTYTMTDAEAAKVLTLLKQAMVNMASTNSYANVLLTLRGCPVSVFDPQKDPSPTPIPGPVKAGFSALILLAAYNMIAPHIGSERL